MALPPCWRPWLTLPFCYSRFSVPAAGTCLNRWYDKTLQLIVCENGSAGVNFEHSHLDGHTVLRFASDVFTDTILYVSIGAAV